MCAFYADMEHIGKLQRDGLGMTWVGSLQEMFSQMDLDGDGEVSRISDKVLSQLEMPGLPGSH